MPSWKHCFESVVIGRVQRRWSRSPISWDDELLVDARSTIEGAKTPGEALVYSYSYLNHHVGAAAEAFKLGCDGCDSFEECILIDYGCGPGTALMALAETYFEKFSAPLTVHYVGVDTADCPNFAIAQELFDCVKNNGLISNASTITLSDVSLPLPFPQGTDICPVFVAFCFVLAHPYFDPPVAVPGRPAAEDPVDRIAQELQRCRDFYKRSVRMVYTNANYHPDRPVHYGWSRLLRKMGLAHSVQKHTYRYRVFGSDRINGVAPLLSWQMRQFRFPKANWDTETEAPCDFKSLLYVAP